MNTFMNNENLILRPICSEDKDMFLIWHNDPDMREKIGGIFPFTEYTYRQICKGDETDTPPNIWFALCLDDHMIGIVGLHNIRYVQRNAEIAFLIGEHKYRKKGYGVKALALLEKYAFCTLGLHRIYAYIYSDNIASISLVEKCHFCKEGILHEANYWNGKYRDVYVYAKLNKQNP